MFYGSTQHWPRHGPFNGTMDDVNVTEGGNFASRDSEVLLLLAAIRAQRLNPVTYERESLKHARKLCNFDREKKKGELRTAAHINRNSQIINPICLLNEKTLSESYTITDLYQIERA